MKSLTDQYVHMSGQTRSLESQARRMTNDASRLRKAIQDLTFAVESISVRGPVSILRKAAEDIAAGGQIRHPEASYLMAAE